MFQEKKNFAEIHYLKNAGNYWWAFSDISLVTKTIKKQGVIYVCATKWLCGQKNHFFKRIVSLWIYALRIKWNIFVCFGATGQNESSPICEVNWDFFSA